MKAARLRVDELRQRVDVGALQFRHLAMLDDPHRDGRPGPVEGRQLFERLLVGAGLVRLRRALLHGQLELLEQQFAVLLGRGDVELPAGRLVDLLFDALQLPLHLDAELLQERRIDADAGVLHLGQHADERDFEGVVERAQLGR